jgi:protochlorophyllide reductase
MGWDAHDKMHGTGCTQHDKACPIMACDELPSDTDTSARSIVDSLQEQYGDGLKGIVSPEECDLSSMESIRGFAKRWQDSGSPIDVLSLNAGAQFTGEKEPRRTKDGFELTVGANHLGHFLLANLLLDSVEKSTKSPRIVVTASEVIRLP